MDGRREDKTYKAFFVFGIKQKVKRANLLKKKEKKKKEWGNESV
jgi:hypothetical protein